jgi:eukaryotic-like serine/threonine-protein kinase
MALTVGAKLGPYEIVSSVGAGGMGEVYRARDTRLDRTVAVKILPSLLAASSAARQRFEREARAISSLSHPHICQLYDVGRHDGLDYLVLEYLDGETLQHRLERGPLPLEQVLKLGIEIADALEKAHGKGITHRDLKPANIMLSKSGAKLLDFGVAKPTTSALTDVATAITESRPLTTEGTIIGTFHYMSPEQVEGREADARSDIFALGSVLYEATTGNRAFDGRTPATVIAAVLEREPPPITSVQPTPPPLLNEVIKTCIRKDPDERFQTAHDLKLQLQWIANGLTGSGTHPESLPARKSKITRERVLWSLAVLLLLLAVPTTWILRKPQPMPVRADSMRFEITAPAGMRFPAAAQGGADAAISPDGKRVVFVAESNTPSIQSFLWIRSLDSTEPTQLPGTEGAQYPFWSPDNEAVGFFAAGKLRRVPINGGDPETLASFDNPMGGTWNSHGIILAGTRAGAIYKVSDTGGTPQQLTKLDASKQETTHRWPHFLPDGNHFIFECGVGGVSELNRICAAALDSPAAKTILTASSNARYASGYLFYFHEGALHAHPFDIKTLAVTAPPTHVVERVSYNQDVGRSPFAASDELLLYQTARSPEDSTALYVVTNWKAILAKVKPDTD